MYACTPRKNAVTYLFFSSCLNAVVLCMALSFFFPQHHVVELYSCHAALCHSDRPVQRPLLHAVCSIMASGLSRLGTNSLLDQEHCSPLGLSGVGGVRTLGFSL